MGLHLNQIISDTLACGRVIGGVEIEEQQMNTSTYFSDGVQTLSKHQKGLAVCLRVEVKAPKIIQNLQYTK